MAEKIENIEYYRNAFAGMQSIDDLLVILNTAKKEIYGEKSVTFSTRQFNYYSLSKNKSAHYKQFLIPKKNGGKRTIHAPVKGLKHLQACLNYVLQALFEPHKAAMGFVPGKSIVDNAQKHIGKGFVYNLDLKNFFPSIDQKRVWAVLLLPPFNLGDSSERRQIANRIAILCAAPIEFTLADGSKEIRNVLPQGAPTSPTLTNIIAQRLDRKLQGVAKRYQLTYTRYADDITFSSNKNLFHKNSEVITEIRRIIQEQNFTINEGKVRLQQQGYRQEVTGIIVNEKTNVPKRYIKQLRKWLYLWETYGHDRAYFMFLKDYIGDKGHVKNNMPSMDCVIGGKLDYLKMVRGEKDNLFNKLNNRYDILLTQTTRKEKKEDSISPKPRQIVIDNRIISIDGRINKKEGIVDKLGSFSYTYTATVGDNNIIGVTVKDFKSETDIDTHGIEKELSKLLSQSLTNALKEQQKTEMKRKDDIATKNEKIIPVVLEKIADGNFEDAMEFYINNNR